MKDNIMQGDTRIDMSSISALFMLRPSNYISAKRTFESTKGVKRERGGEGGERGRELESVRH